MKKNNAKRTVVVIALIALMAIPSMFAYFTDAHKVTNVFTVGNVDITLSETWTPNDGLLVAPGKTITKAPTIALAEGSNDAYVFAKVTMPVDGTTEFCKLNDVPAGWVLVNENPNDGVYIYAYGTDSAMTAWSKDGVNTSTLFSSVTINEITEGFAPEGGINVEITAYAIQTNNLAGDAKTPADVWALVKDTVVE